MSRMTKFLKQTCSFESAKRDASGKVMLNKYGEIEYQKTRSLKCRRESTIKDIKTANGALTTQTTAYYTDESQPIRVDDRVDGRVILLVNEYVNAQGAVEGYEFYA